jgi:lipopolysaccharide transport system permease protein
VVGLIEGFRWSVLGGAPASTTMLMSMVIGVSTSLVMGMIIFQKIEPGFADIV